jgi:hypothetical protein
MDDYQEEKDNPRKQVVDMEVEELYVKRFRPFMATHTHGIQVLPAVQVLH